MAILLVVLLALIVVPAIAGWALWQLISAAIVGAIIGGIARLVVPGRHNIGILRTIVIGWIGSLIGSFFGRHVFHVGTLLTLACEVALAAILVMIASGSSRKAVARRKSSLPS